MLKSILCHDAKNGIGLNNQLPWKIKSEMNHFIQETTNKTVVMGRKTFDSLNKRPLKNRRNIVFTRNANIEKVDGFEFISDVNYILEISKNEDVYVIGGSQIYKLFEDYIDEYVISKLDQDYQCDTFFNFSKVFFKLNSSEQRQDFKLERWIRNNKVINGRKTSNEIIEAVKIDFNALIKDPSKNKFIVIQVGNDYASSVYVGRKIKIASYIGIANEHIILDENISQDELLKIVKKYNEDNNVGAILVQNPLPKQIDESIIASNIDPKKDVDCFNPLNSGILFSSSQNSKNELLSPCTPLGIVKILKAYNVELTSKDVVIINRSNIVGKPLSILLMNENCTVTTCHTRTKELKEKCQNADIIVSATGMAKWIKKDFIKPNAICIDVGINRDQNRLCGDFDFDDVIDKCDLITPVPFGIGPMTIAMLFYNYMKLQKNK